MGRWSLVMEWQWRLGEEYQFGMEKMKVEDEVVSGYTHVPYAYIVHSAPLT